MSFKFNWDSFNDENFYDRARTLLTDALNKGKKPPILSDRIIVRELYLGEESPQLEILEVGDLAADMFRGIFKLTYNGEASITLATKVQANPLKVYSMSAPSFCTPKFMGASAPLDIPLNLTLSDIRLSGIIILVFSKAKGLTLVFRNDPLQSIRVSSTFDALPGIARFLQGQIENQIRSLFREELPAILHRLSHRWTPSGGLVLHKGAIKDNEQVVTQTEDENSDNTRVSFMEINPDMPVLSRSNMFKINSIGLGQRTLSLFTPSLPETVYRANLELSEEHYSGGYIQKLAGGASDLADIARIQSRNYFRNAHARPKRRVIKLNRNNATPAAPVEASPETQTLQTPKPEVKVEAKPPATEAVTPMTKVAPPMMNPSVTAVSNNKDNQAYQPLLIPKQSRHASSLSSQLPLHEKDPLPMRAVPKALSQPITAKSKRRMAGTKKDAGFIPPPPAYVA